MIRAALIEAGQYLGRDTVLIAGCHTDPADDPVPNDWGADRIARSVWLGWGLPFEGYPADWSGDCDRTWPGCRPGHRLPDRLSPGDTYCPQAGPRRNQTMVNQLHGLALVGHQVLLVGFPYPGQKSGGTFDCVRRARLAGLPDPWLRSDLSVGMGRAETAFVCRR
jgi:hypothetical protein